MTKANALARCYLDFIIDVEINFDKATRDTFKREGDAVTVLLMNIYRCTGIQNYRFWEDHDKRCTDWSLHPCEV